MKRCSWCGMELEEGDWEVWDGQAECINKWACELRVLQHGHGESGMGEGVG